MAEIIEFSRSGESVRMMTERLVLRRPRAQDRDFFIQLYTKPDVMKHINYFGQPDNPPQADARFRKLLDHWEREGYGMFLLEWKDQPIPLGYCGLRILSRIDNPELGYIIDQPYWGKGIASEAGHAAIRFAVDRLHLPGLIALTSPENEVSQNILYKLGFKRHPERDGSYHGDDSYFFELLFS